MKTALVLRRIYGTKRTEKERENVELRVVIEASLVDGASTITDVMLVFVLRSLGSYACWCL